MNENDQDQGTIKAAGREASELSELLCCDCEITINLALAAAFKSPDGSIRCAGCHVHLNVTKRTKPWMTRKLVIETVPT